MTAVGMVNYNNRMGQGASSWKTFLYKIIHTSLFEQGCIVGIIGAHFIFLAVLQELLNIILEVYFCKNSTFRTAPAI